MLKSGFVFLILVVFSVNLLGQKIELPAGKLSDAISYLEANTPLVFNFDPNTIKGLVVEESKSLDLSDFHSSIEDLLSQSRLDFEINEELVLLFESKKQETRICGKLYDKSSGSPLPFAHVFIDEHFGTWTDDNGAFDFSKLMWKNEKVSISYLGYKDVALRGQDFLESCNEIGLEADAVILSKEIVVRDYVIPAITKGKSYNGYQVNLNTMHKEMGVIEKDLFKNLQFLPGVSSLDESAGNLIIRGADAHQNLILWEGTPLYGSGHFFGMISSINPFISREVELYKTVHHAKYDNRIGGVIDIKLSETSPKEIKGGFGSTLTEAHGDLEMPIIKDKLSVSLAGRHSLINEFDEHPTLRAYGEKLFQSTTLMQDQVDLEENESEFRSSFYDYNFKLHFTPTEKLKFTSSIFESRNTFFHEYEFVENQILGIDSFYVSNLLWNSKLEYTWSDRSKSYVEVSQSRFNSESMFTIAEDVEEDEGFRNNKMNSIRDLQIRFGQSFQISKSRLDLGYIMDRKNLSYFLAESSLYEEDYEFSEDQVGLYHHLFSNVEYRFKKFYLNGGLRATYDSEHLTTRISPRINIRRPFKKYFNLSLSGGLFHQYIRQIEDYTESQLNIDNRIWYLGDEDIMSSRKFSLGLGYQKSSWLIEAETYLHRSDDVTLLSTIQSEALGIEENGQILSRGLEVLVKKRWKNLNSAISYHLSYLDVQFTDLEDDFFPANNDQRHNFSWINYYHIKNWSFGLQYYFRSGLPYTEINGIELVEDDEEEYYELTFDMFNSQRLGNFHRLDASLSYSRPINHRAYLDIQFFMNNIFDFSAATNRNDFLSDIDQEDDEPEILSLEKFQLARSPQILLRLSF